MNIINIISSGMITIKRANIRNSVMKRNSIKAKKENTRKEVGFDFIIINYQSFLETHIITFNLQVIMNLLINLIITIRRVMVKKVIMIRNIRIGNISMVLISIIMMERNGAKKVDTKMEKNMDLKSHIRGINKYK